MVTPATLAPAGTAAPSAAYPVPGAQAAGPLTDTASVTWTDTNNNPYGPVSANFTTTVLNAAPPAITLAPTVAGPDPTGGTQILTATVTNSVTHAPLSGVTVGFAVTGANPTAGSAVSDGNGHAVFTLSGVNAGTDVAQASITSGSNHPASNTATVFWVSPVAKASTTPVTGNFYPAGAGDTTFTATQSSIPAFSQNFPNIAFNPPAGTVPHNVFGIDPTSTPFTDVTTDIAGNATGTLIAAGNGHAAGAGDLTNFDAAYTGNLVVTAPGDLTFAVTANSGFVFGVGNGATRTSGELVNAPPATAMTGLSVLGAFNQPGTETAAHLVTVHFGTPGSYPYELDFFKAGGGNQSLVLSTVTDVPQQPSGVSVGYADTTQPPGTASFPAPWNGSPNTTFVGSPGPYDSGAIKVDNTTATKPLRVDAVSVDIGSRHYQPLPGGQDVPPGSSLVLTGLRPGDFDTSEAGQSSIPLGGGPPPAGLSVAGGYAVKTFVSGFPAGAVGPIGMAFDANNNMFVTNSWSNQLYKFPAAGGAASPATLLNPALGGVPAGLTFSKSGRLYGTAYNGDQLFELDPGTGNVIRVVVSGLGGGALSVLPDPLSNDLFVSAGGRLSRVSGFEGPGPVVASAYGPGGIDGLTVTPDGTLYGLQSGFNVLRIAGSNTPQPAAVTVVATVPGGDGIGVLAPSIPGGPVTQLVVNRTDGRLTKVDLVTNTQTDIFSGGTRGDFVTTGPDGCLYATQSNTILKITSTDGTCPFVPTLCVTNPTIPQVHVTINGTTFTYPDTARTLTGGGVDGDHCGGTNESRPWNQISTGTPPTPTLPLPPVATLTVQPSVTTNAVPGTAKSFIVSAVDSTGAPIPNLVVTVAVGGVNPRTFTATTDGSGNATVTYTGTNPGVDTLAATAFVAGAQIVSNTATINWTVIASGGPTGGHTGTAPPYVTILNPADGTPAATATPVRALVNPAAGTTINNWTVSTQAVPAGTPQTLTTGTGTPPTQLAIFDPTGKTAGTWAISVTATGSNGATATAVTHVIIGPLPTGGTPPPTGPTIGPCTPADGTLVTEPGTVTCPINTQPGTTITAWTLTIAPAGAPTTEQRSIATGAGPTATGPIDPTVLNNGIWTITATATANNGGTATITTTIVVDGKLKLGEFSQTFQDLNVPVGGLPLQVTRTYDSFNRTHNGDFGYGWNLGVSNFRVQVNRPLGQGPWTIKHDCYQIEALGGFYWQPCYTQPGRKYVTVTWPDGHTETFDYFPTNTYQFPNIGTSTYKPTGNATSTLTPGPDDPGFAWFGGDFQTDFYNPDTLYNPTRFTLTAKDGTKYVLDTNTGLVSAEDRHHNTITVDDTGVRSSLGPSITWTRDPQHRITGVTGPGRSLAYTYDGTGNLATVTDPASRVTTFDYFADHYLHGITGPGSVSLSKTTYTADGRVDTITDINGHVTTVHDNPGTRVEQVDRSDGRGYTRSTFDARGNPTTVDGVLDGITHTSTLAYNPHDLVTTRTDPNHHTWNASYDAADNLTSFSDANGHGSTITYNSFKQPTSMTDNTGHSVSFDYDPNTGDLLILRDPDGHGRSYAYDATGNVTSSRLPGKPLQYNTYYPDGKLRTRTDANNQTTTYNYDPAGNLTGETRPEGPVTYTYNPDNQRTSMTDQTGTTTYGIDNLGRVTSVASPQGTINYGYNGAQRTSMNTPTASFTYGYDNAGQLNSVVGPAGNFGLTYAYGGVATISRPNNVTTTNTYDPAGRLTDIAHKNAANATLAQFAYTLDPNGNRTKLDQTVNGSTWTETYSLDTLDRLTSVNYSDTGQTTTYGYTPGGNRTTMTVAGAPSGNGVTAYTYDAAQQLTSYNGPSGARTPAYDGNGNQTSDGAGSAFTFNSQNMMTATAGAVGAHAYIFNADGVRVSADGANQLWDQTTKLPLLINDGTSTQTYAGDQLLAQTAAGVSTFPLADGLGSTRLITDATGNAVSSSRHDVYGALRASTGTQSAFGYTGQQTDSTGIINLRARLYSPGSGRFISLDTVQPNGWSTQGYSLYGYVQNNPTSLSDPSGHDTLKEYLGTLKDNAKAYASEKALGQRVTACIAAVMFGIQTTPSGPIWWAARVKDCIQAAVKKP